VREILATPGNEHFYGVSAHGNFLARENPLPKMHFCMERKLTFKFWIVGSELERKLRLSRQLITAAVELLARFVFVPFGLRGGRNINKNFEIREVR